MSQSFLEDNALLTRWYHGAVPYELVRPLSAKGYRAIQVADERRTGVYPRWGRVVDEPRLFLVRYSPEDGSAELLWTFMVVDDSDDPIRVSSTEYAQKLPWRKHWNEPLEDPFPEMAYAWIIQALGYDLLQFEGRWGHSRISYATYEEIPEGIPYLGKSREEGELKRILSHLAKEIPEPDYAIDTEVWMLLGMGLPWILPYTEFLEWYRSVQGDLP